MISKMKQKTRKSVQKRIKVTGTGKLLRRASFSRHLRRNKSKKTLRRYKKFKVVTGRIARTTRRRLALA